jgi:hypothetical protein
MLATLNTLRSTNLEVAFAHCAKEVRFGTDDISMDLEFSSFTDHCEI